MHDRSKPVKDAYPPDLLVQRLADLLAKKRRHAVARMETHISWILLDGAYAWKLKKPVRMGFLDFTKLSVRQRACNAELHLNKRLAPMLYLDVVPIYGSPEAPRLESGGKPIEYAVRMKQFAQEDLLSERLEARRLDGTLIDALADRIAAFHQAAPVALEDVPYGTPHQIQGQWHSLFAALRANQESDRRLARVQGWVGAQWESLAAIFNARKTSGWVREGHGDLHLGNLVVLGDAVTAFDCIEFDPALRWIDIQCDIAFVTMDLSAHRRADFACRFLNRWLEATGDYEGLLVLRHYEVYRALVRALVKRLPGAERGTKEPDYLSLAEELTEPRKPRLMITHGVSGSGKSYVSGRLLEIAGAIRLRSDVERKRLFGLRPLDDSWTLLHKSIYEREATRNTYTRLQQLAAAILEAGYPVIVDAAFLGFEERAQFAALARSKHVPFAILDCRAQADLLRQRVIQRSRRRDDPSEAGLDVLERQLAAAEPLRPEEEATSFRVCAGHEFDVRTIADRWRQLG